jgi:hypothetical protein
MAGQGTLILAADYNGIQSKVAGILGTGSGTSGYGQTLASAQVAVGDPIRASQWTALRYDIIRARTHQTGFDMSDQIATIVAGETVASNSIEVSYNDFADLIIANKLTTNYSTMGTVENVISPYSNSNAWNGTRTNVVTINFGSADNARFFFNSGGNFQISSALDGGSGSSKTNTWSTMLSTAGVVTMNYTTTTTSGTGNPSNVGWYSLSTIDQEIFNQPAPSGAYSPNYYRIFAKTNPAASQLILTTAYYDYDVGFYDAQGDYRGDTSPGGYRQDESVDGTLSNTVQMFRATGSYVSISAPTSSQTGF